MDNPHYGLSIRFSFTIYIQILVRGYISVDRMDTRNLNYYMINHELI